MAYSVVFEGAEDGGEPEAFFLCSIGAWGEFSSWASGLPSSPKLRELASRGTARGTDALASELAAALTSAPPKSAGVAATAAALADIVGLGRPAETITITDD